MSQQKISINNSNGQGGDPQLFTFQQILTKTKNMRR